MSNIRKKGSGGEPNPLENQLLTADGLKNKLAQLSGEELFYEALVLTYITGILIMLYIGWRDK